MKLTDRDRGWLLRCIITPNYILFILQMAAAAVLGRRTWVVCHEPYGRRNDTENRQVIILGDLMPMTRVPETDVINQLQKWSYELPPTATRFYTMN